MATLSGYFAVMAEASLVAFLVLGVGSLLVALLRQPIERARSIEMTLVALVATLVLRQSQVLPALPVGWLRPAVTANDAGSVAATMTAAPTQAPLSRPNAESTASSGRLANIEAERAEVAASPGNRLVPSYLIAFRALCVAIVIAGSGWCIVRWAAGRRQLGMIVRESTPVDEHCVALWPERSEAARRRVRILASSRVDVPLTCGVWRPVIIVPSSFLTPTGWTELSACLTHEWGHVAHRDALVWMVIRAIEPFVWFQPFFWWLKRELRVCQDQLADASVVSASGDPTSYAALLASLARRRVAWTAMPALSMIGRSSHLLRRIESLLSDTEIVNLRARRCVTAAGVFTLGLSALLVAAIGTRNVAAIEKPADSAAAAKPGESLSFSGTVVDATTKQPIAGAEVTVRRSLLQGLNNRIIEETKHTTDEAGAYHFVIPPEQVAEKYLYIELDVKHPGHVTRQGFGYSLSMIRKNIKLGERPFFEHVTLQTSDPVTGRVVDPDGKPMVGVLVRACTAKSDRDLNGLSWPLVKTDADGRFRIEAIVGGSCVVWVVPDKFSPLQFVLGTKHGDLGDVKVEPGISLRGVVLDVQGKPVSGVWVNLDDVTAARETKMSIGTSMVRTALTDNEGQFVMGPLMGGLCELRVDSFPREAKYEDRAQTNTPVKGVFLNEEIDLNKIDPAIPIKITAVPQVEVRGRFVDSKGKPTSGWEVSADGRVGDKSVYATWNVTPEGEFSGQLARGLERGELRFMSNEHAALRVRLRPGEPLKAGSSWSSTKLTTI